MGLSSDSNNIFNRINGAKMNHSRQSPSTNYGRLNNTVGNRPCLKLPFCPIFFFYKYILSYYIYYYIPVKINDVHTVSYTLTSLSYAFRIMHACLRACVQVFFTERLFEKFQKRDAK